MKKLFAPLFFAILLFASLLLSGCVAQSFGGKTAKATPPALYEPWCLQGKSYEANGVSLKAVGQVQKFGIDACRLTTVEGDVSADFYLDQEALRELKYEGKAKGSGCVTLFINSTNATNSFCFGSANIGIK